MVLDFWTYCCINCMHVLPDLAYLETKFRDQPMTVVGVHSAKFDNEKDSGAIRNAVLRYDVTHPVVNDGEMVMWRQLGVSSWPTLAVVSPNGRLIAMLAGEGHRDVRMLRILPSTSFPSCIFKNNFSFVQTVRAMCTPVVQFLQNCSSRG